MSPEKRNDGWWISFGLRWALIFFLLNNYDPLRWLRVDSPGIRVASLAWFAEQAFGIKVPAGFWDLSVDLLGAIPLAFIWTIFDRRKRNNEVIREVAYLLVRFSLAAGMIQYGADKVIGDQGYPQPGPLEWIRPLGEISTRVLMWTWLGYSNTFKTFAGLNELIGGLLLFFRRTTLLGALLVLPVMAYVTVLDVTFSVGPVESRAAFFLVCALYLVAREWRRVAGVLLFQKPTAASSFKKLWTSPRPALVRRGLWILVVAVTLWRYLPWHFRDHADIAGRQSPLCGAYRVDRFVSDGRVLPAEAADAARWREVAINCFGDYIRVRRMDDGEMLWSAYPGTPYRFGVGANYKYGDYGSILARTAGTQSQVKFRELPTYRSPHPVPASKPVSGPFFTVNFARKDSDHVSVQGRIDGAEISADLLRIRNDDVEFFKTRGGLP